MAPGVVRSRHRGSQPASARPASAWSAFRASLLPSQPSIRRMGLRPAGRTKPPDRDYFGLPGGAVGAFPGLDGRVSRGSSVTWAVGDGLVAGASVVRGAALGVVGGRRRGRRIGRAGLVTRLAGCCTVVSPGGSAVPGLGNAWVKRVNTKVPAPSISDAETTRRAHRTLRCGSRRRRSRPASEGRASRAFLLASRPSLPAERVDSSSPWAVISRGFDWLTPSECFDAAATRRARGGPPTCLRRSAAGGLSLRRIPGATPRGSPGTAASRRAGRAPRYRRARPGGSAGTPAAG